MPSWPSCCASTYACQNRSCECRVGVCACQSLSRVCVCRSYDLRSRRCVVAIVCSTRSSSRLERSASGRVARSGYTRSVLSVRMSVPDERSRVRSGPTALASVRIRAPREIVRVASVRISSFESAREIVLYRQRFRRCGFRSRCSRLGSMCTRVSSMCTRVGSM